MFSPGSSTTSQINVDNRIHCINSLHYEPRKYSCAVDTFLEICHSVMFPLLSNVQMSNFWDLLCFAMNQYNKLICSNTDGFTPATMLSLSNIRELVWESIRFLCPSFNQMDDNAQFSQISEVKNFKLTTDEKEMF